MPSSFDIEQTDRLLNVTSPLGVDQLILTAFTGTEQLSGLFTFDLELVSPEQEIDPTLILGKPIGWSVKKPGGGRRPFHGFVGAFGGGGSFSRGYRWYHAAIFPAFWMLTHTANCRIFQQKSVPDIIREVLADFPDVILDCSGITGTHPVREYCVQYRESDFAFLCRLMEEEGIFYYFQHDTGSHTMVVADSKATYFDCLGTDITFGDNPDIESYVTKWEPRRLFRGGKWVQRDYNFETPTNPLQSSVNTVVTIPEFQSYEYFDYPGLYPTTAIGDAKTRWRMEQEEVDYQSADGESTSVELTPAGRFTLATHVVGGQKSSGHVVTRISHHASDYTHVSGEGTGTPPDYGNSFSVMPDDTVFRPPRTTPRPTMGGVHPAIVTGPSGEEIYCDKYGRIKVQFPWDRLGTNDERSSCYIRVAQMMAGPKWGGQFIPRVGMEVLVDFLEGDPDRPIIVGCAYNAVNMPPYALPAQKTQSGIKTHSTLNGGANNYNELRFDDKIGSEVVTFQAERDLNSLIKHDETRTIGHDLTTDIKHDETRTVGNDQTITIDQGDRDVTLNQGDDSLTISTGDRTVTISQGDRDVTLDQGDDSLTLSAGDLTIKLDQGSVMIEAAEKITLKVGGTTLVIDENGAHMTGGQAINLKVGGSTLDIDAGSIALQANQVTING